MRRTNTYRLEFQEPGEAYTAAADYRRFVTLDYNLSQYVGIAGDGVIRGWTISYSSGLVVNVDPGAGFIQGFYTESPYYRSPSTGELKKKSQALADGDVINEVVPGWSNPKSTVWGGVFYTPAGGRPYEEGKIFKQLGPRGEDTDFDGIVDSVLEPVYQNPPDDFFDDPYVKASPTAMHALTLADNADNYIFARRAGTEPSVTDAEFFSSTSSSFFTTAVLLAKVVTRSGAVSSISYDGVQSLQNMRAALEAIAKDLLPKHHHGGSLPYDPVKIRLNTDIRQARITSANASTGAVSYLVLPSFETDVEQDHKHTYTTDSSGNGSTSAVIGDGVDQHYHAISSWVTTSTVKTYGSSLPDHTHTIPETNDTLSPSSTVRVSVNGREIAGSLYSIRVSGGSRYIDFAPGAVSTGLPIYSVTIPISSTETYYYEERNLNIRQVILRMMNDFYKTYQDKLGGFDDDGNAIPATVRDPFVFYLVSGANAEPGRDGLIIADPTPVDVWPEGAVAQTEYTDKNTLTASGDYKRINADMKILPLDQPLEDQSAAAAAQLEEEGDSFTLLPTLARFVPVTLKEKAKVDAVVIEILDNVEVQGVLRPESIFFISADSIVTGKFSYGNIPFISHAGRVKEPFSPVRTTAYTDDCIRYSASAASTTVALGHSHKSSYNRAGNGGTVATLVGNKVAVYEMVGTEPVRITHTHPVVSGVMGATIHDGVNVWQSQAAGTSHTHNIIVQAAGDAKVVYSVTDDGSGNLYAGTSDGLMLVPDGLCFKITIGSSIYYDYLVTAGAAALNAASSHYYAMGQEIELGADALSSLASLTSVGASTTVSGLVISDASGSRQVPYPVNVTVSVLDNCPSKAMHKDSWKDMSNITPDDEVLRPFTVTIENYTSYADVLPGSVYKDFNNAPPDSTMTYTIYRTRADYQKEPVWSLDVAAGEAGPMVSVCTPVRILEGLLSEASWTEVPMAPRPAVTRKVSRMSWGDMWACTSSGILAARSGAGAKSFRTVGLPGGYADVQDILQSEESIVLATAPDGVYSTDRVGLSWTKRLSCVGPVQLSRDHSLDVASLASGHIHYLAVNREGNGFTASPIGPGGTEYTGPAHTHVVTGWVVATALSHTHTIASTVYCRTGGGKIYKSEDSGTTWSDTGTVPATYGERGPVAAAFGVLIASTEGRALYSTDSGATWADTDLLEPALSFGWSYWLDSVLVGTRGRILATGDGKTFSEEFLWGGAPVPSLYIDSSLSTFDNAFSNESGSFFLRQKASAGSRVETVLSYDFWEAENGSWPDGVDYNIYINSKEVISTKEGIDRRSELGLNFSVVPSQGMLDFSVSTSLALSVVAGDSSIVVASTSGFMAGQPVSIVAFTSSGTALVRNKVDAVLGSTVLSLVDPMAMDVSTPATVKAVSALDIGNVIKGDILSSYLANAGKNTHEELEDGLSYQSAGLPLKLSDTYLGNMSRLVAAVKIAKPGIDANLRCWKAYMMRYDPNPGDPNYIGNDFDLQESILRSGTLISPAFSPAVSASVNVVAPGSGSFSGLILAGTDAGIFTSVLSPSLEGNWFILVSHPEGSVNDILILNNGSVLAATSAGLFASKGGSLTDWSAVSESAADGSAGFITMRWKNFGQPGAYWWNCWSDDGQTNLFDPDLTNTIIVGGDTYVVYSLDMGKSWTKSSVSLPSSYSASCLLPVSNGSALMGVNNALLSDGSRLAYILSSTSGGAVWGTNAQSLGGYAGKVTGLSVTDSNNTMLSVSLTTSYSPAENVLVGLVFTSGKNSFNITANWKGVIVLRGTGALDLVSVNDTFKVTAPTISSMVETEQEGVLAGTSQGIFYDRGTYLSQGDTGGVVKGVNKVATVDSVDITGQVGEVGDTVLQGSSGTTQTALVCTLDSMVGANEMAGRKLVIVSSNFPSVNILSPFGGSSISGTAVAVRLSLLNFGLGTSGYVALSIDGGDPVYVTSLLYTFEEVNSGSHTIKAWLTDTSKTPLTNPEASREVGFNTSAPTNAPSLSILYPTDNLVISTPTTVATVKVANFSLLTDGGLGYSVDGAATAVVAPTASTAVDISITNLSQGAHTFRAVLLDPSGSEISSTASTVDFSVSAGTEPFISISYPMPGAVLLAGSVTLSYTLSNFTPPTDGFVKIVLDGIQTLTSSSPTNFSISGLTDGSHTVTMSLVDSAMEPVSGKFSSASTTFTVNSAAADVPKIFIVTPASGVTIPAGGYTDVTFNVVSFDIPDDGGIVLQVNGGAETFLADISVPYKLSISSPGAYTVKATLAASMTDRLTNPEATATSNFTVGSESLAQAPVAQSRAVAEAEVATPQASGSATAARQTESSSSEEVEKSWKIISNESSSVTGATIITVEGDVDSTMDGANFRVVGNTSILSVTFLQPVSAGEFDGGTMYVDPEEGYNGGKTYSVVSQTPTRVTLSVLINPAAPSGSSESDPDVQPGQKVRFIPSDGSVRVWMEFSELWGNEELAGKAFTLRTEATGDNSYTSFISSGNDLSSVTLVPGSDFTSISEGDYLLLSSPAFGLLPSFSFMRTTLDLDHYHGTSLMGKVITGSVLSIDRVSTSYVDVYVTGSDDFQSPLLIDHPEILNDAEITLFSPTRVESSCVKSIEFITPQKMRIRIGDETNWNFDGTQPYGIQAGFSWRIDTRQYGITASTSYDSVVVAVQPITQDVSVGSTQVKVPDTSLFAAGQGIELWDATGARTTGTVLSVPNITTINLASPAGAFIRTSQGGQARARGDSLPSADHEHLIRRGEVSTEVVTALEALGYPREHNHILSSLIQSISGLVREEDTGRILAAGSGSLIYYSDDGGDSWGVLVDVNTLMEGFGEVGKITTISLSPSGDVMAGTDTGHVVAQTAAAPEGDMPLDYPFSDEYLPSSSSSSSESSSESSGSSPSQTSLSTFSSNQSASSSSSPLSSESSRSTSSASSGP